MEEEPEPEEPEEEETGKEHLNVRAALVVDACLRACRRFELRACRMDRLARQGVLVTWSARHASELVCTSWLVGTAWFVSWLAQHS